MKLKEIGRIHSCFKEKFGTPRQSGLSQSSKGLIELFKDFSHEDIVRELDSFSHIWAIFHFHKAKGWKPTVRPPRLGGSQKVGVFASRSPFRPNPIGMSILKLEGIKRKNGQIFIEVSGIDLIDKTPILDIKPYIPSIDVRANATDGWQEKEFGNIEKVTISSHLKIENPELIREVICLDPRPAHQKNQERTYKLRIGDIDVHWRVKDNQAEVFEIINL